MGCGGSKDVAPSDVPAAKAGNKGADTSTARDIEEVSAPGKFERGTSFVVPMGDDEDKPKPKPKHLRRLEEGGNNSPKLSKADLEEKQRKAEERRKAQLDEKTEFAREDDARLAEIGKKSAKEKKQAAKAIASKLDKAEYNRDEELSAKKRSGQQASVKGKKARARRLDDALQAGKDDEIEGEADSDSGDDEVEM